MKRIYLDACTIQRPQDDRSQLRVALEVEAVIAILHLCSTQKVELVSSTALLLEIGRNPHADRREYAESILELATIFITTNDEIVEKAKQLNSIGFKAIDALHLAAAEMAKCDYFCTCDDRMLRRAKTLNELSFKPVSPLELVEELEE